MSATKLSAIDREISSCVRRLRVLQSDGGGGGVCVEPFGDDGIEKNSIFLYKSTDDMFYSAVADAVSPLMQQCLGYKEFTRSQLEENGIIGAVWLTRDDTVLASVLLQHGGDDDSDPMYKLFGVALSDVGGHDVYMRTLMYAVESSLRNGTLVEVRVHLHKSDTDLLSQFYTELGYGVKYADNGDGEKVMRKVVKDINSDFPRPDGCESSDDEDE